MENTGFMQERIEVKNSNGAIVTLTIEQILASMFQGMSTLNAKITSIQNSLESVEMLIGEHHIAFTEWLSVCEGKSTPSVHDGTLRVNGVQNQQKQRGVLRDFVLEGELSALSWWITAYDMPALVCKSGEEVSTALFSPHVRDGHSFTAHGYHHLALPHFLRWLRTQQHGEQRNLYPKAHMTQPRLCQLLKRAGWKASAVHSIMFDENGQKLWRQRRYWRKPV